MYDAIPYRLAYYPICREHGPRPTDAGPHTWQARCDLCGRLTDTFNRVLVRVLPTQAA